MDKTLKVIIVIVLIAAVVVAVVVRRNRSSDEQVPNEYKPDKLLGKGLPTLVDLGSDQCIPCKMMAPIIEELKSEYAGKLQVSFLDVRKYRGLSELYGIKVIPTQIFYDASGKELFRHEGFFSKEDILAKWVEFDVNLVDSDSELSGFERFVPAWADTRPKDTVCYMCDRDINNKTMVQVQTNQGPVKLCSPHCYFIMYSCLTEDKTDFDKKVSVTDWSTGEPIAAEEAMYLYGLDDQTGRPMIKAFAGKIQPDQATSGGTVINWQVLRDKELATRCGFCDRACYPQDAAEVIVEGGLRTWGCCSHCALGVAARTGKDIEVHEKDRLIGEEIIVKTFGGKIASLEPRTAVAWFGQRQKPDGTWGSAGCFHQGFFVNKENLEKWVEQNPYETGKLISIGEALTAKMKLSPEQIQKACKIGECIPK